MASETSPSTCQPANGYARQNYNYLYDNEANHVVIGHGIVLKTPSAMTSLNHSRMAAARQDKPQFPHSSLTLASVIIQHFCLAWSFFCHKHARSLEQNSPTFTCLKSTKQNSTLKLS